MEMQGKNVVSNEAHANWCISYCITLKWNDPTPVKNGRAQDERGKEKLGGHDGFKIALGAAHRLVVEKAS